MKLRIQDDSIRFRLTRSEVARLGDGLDVEAICRFPGGRALTYALTLADRMSVDARFDAGRIDVALPRERTIAWARSDTVTLPSEASESAATPRVLVEKDFTCVDPRDGDDQSDLFPNPKGRTRQRVHPPSEASKVSTSKAKSTSKRKARVKRKPPAAKATRRRR